MVVLDTVCEKQRWRDIVVCMHVLSILIVNIVVVMEDLEYSVNNTAVFPCNYIFTFLSGLHVSTYFLGHHQVLLVHYLFRSLCKANIDFVFG